MLQDKRKDLDAHKRKLLLDKLLAEVGATDPDLYYRSTSEVALLIKRHIDSKARLHPDERALVARLTQRDIEVLLSLH